MNNFTEHMNNILPSIVNDLSTGEESTNLEKIEREGTRPFYGIKDVTLGPGPIWSITFDYLRKGTPFSKFIDIMKGVEAEKQKRLARGAKSS